MYNLSMKDITIKIHLIFIFILYIHNLLAVSAFPGELSFTQKDGSSFKGHLVGDEWLNYVSLENNYVAIFNKENNNYEYAIIEVKDGKSHLVSSGIKVEDALHLNAPEELAKTISPLNRQSLSDLEPRSNMKKFTSSHNKMDHNKTIHRSKKVLNTKSTQWKEVLKEKNPSK